MACFSYFSLVLLFMSATDFSIPICGAAMPLSKGPYLNDFCKISRFLDPLSPCHTKKHAVPFLLSAFWVPPHCGRHMCLSLTAEERKAVATLHMSSCKYEYNTSTADNVAVDEAVPRGGSGHRGNSKALKKIKIWKKKTIGGVNEWQTAKYGLLP